MLGSRGSGFDAGWLYTKFPFFSNLAEKNLLKVKKFVKCRENGIACLRKGKLRWLVAAEKWCFYIATVYSKLFRFVRSCMFCACCQYAAVFVVYTFQEFLFNYLPGNETHLVSALESVLSKPPPFLLFPFHMLKCIFLKGLHTNSSNCLFTMKYECFFFFERSLRYEFCRSDRNIALR